MIGPVAAVALAAAVTASGICVAPGVPQGTIELREFSILDLDLSSKDRPLAFVSVLAPKDWTSEGGLRWVLDAPCGVEQRVEWRVASPDSATSVAILPAERWTVSSRPPQFSRCPSRNVHSADAYSAEVLDALKLTHRVEAVRERQDIVAQFASVLASYGTQQQTRASAAETRIVLGEGAERRDGLMIAAMVVVTPAPAIPEYESTAFSMPSLLAMAPEGRLDPDLIEAVRASALPNPEWSDQANRILRGMETRPRPPGAEDLIPTPGASAFPVRPAGPEAVFCGAKYTSAGTPGVFRSAEGRIFYIPGGAVLGEKDAKQ